MIRAAFIRRMAFAALACGFLDMRLPVLRWEPDVPDGYFLNLRIQEGGPGIRVRLFEDLPDEAFVRNSGAAEAIRKIKRLGRPWVIVDDVGSEHLVGDGLVFSRVGEGQRIVFRA